MSPRITLLAVALSICLPLQAATESHPAQQPLGEEVLPVAESVLGGQGRVTAYGNQLIVNAPDALILDCARWSTNWMWPQTSVDQRRYPGFGQQHGEGIG